MILEIVSGFGDISRLTSKMWQVIHFIIWMCRQLDLITIVLWPILILKIYSMPVMCVTLYLNGIIYPVGKVSYGIRSLSLSPI
ncbi:hypothetical protein D3C72_1164250 [compost metagenome]